ncbi:MAG TPA: hypothetical protein VFW70_12940 [Methylomirabilota bacterium]|jgi:hypothetical protein|nr:hypothetical protein [Methylomirabilota bacterium]
MTSRGLAVAGLLGALVVASPAWADHNGAPSQGFSAREIYDEHGTRLDVPGNNETSLDINLKLGLNGFRLGGRMFGREGYLGGAWLNGETRKDGFSLDGRVEHEGKAHNFKFNADIDELMQRLLRWRGGALDL